MLNQFSASKIITMNLTVFASTELAKMEQEGMFVQAGIKEKISEVRILLENLDVKKRTEFDTTHATNIIKLLGTLPDEKEILLEKIKNSTMKKLKDDKKQRKWIEADEEEGTDEKKKMYALWWEAG